MRAAKPRTPTTTPAAIPAVLVLLFFELDEVDVEEVPSVADRVTTTVVPGATLVLTTGVFVVPDLVVVPDAAVVVDDDDDDEDEESDEPS